MSRYWMILMLIALLTACQSPAPIVVVPPPTPEPTAIPTPALISVYVSGAVVNPNKVYLLPPRSLAEDAVQAAGGPTAEADLDNINLAAALQEHSHLHVPRKTDPASMVVAVRQTTLPTPLPRININTASVQELDRLPKIGPTTAQQIVDYRSRNGPFQKIEDIKNVKGIGPATFEQIKDWITVDD